MRVFIHILALHKGQQERSSCQKLTVFANPLQIRDEMRIMEPSKAGAA
jgi:hypothetical protein